MAAPTLVTWADLFYHLLDYLGSNPTAEAARDARRAALDGYRELTTAHRWSFYQARGRLQTVAPQTDGTVTYTETGGTYERMVTLADATWPSWAARGQIVLTPNVVYQVAERKSDTVITLDVETPVGEDLAAGTTYTLYQDTYVLPSDMLSVDEMVNANHFLRLHYEQPGAWLLRQRVFRSPASPWLYTIRGDPDHYGAMAVSFFPPPDQLYNFDFLYTRRPRPMAILEYHDGKVSGTSGSATLTGDGTSWNSRHVGAVLRLSSNKIDLPTGITGANPPAAERVVAAVTSTTELTLDTVLTEDYSQVRYTLSDPADVEEGAMLTALLRCCEKQATICRIMDNAKMAQANYKESLILAREADSRNQARRGAPGTSELRRLAWYPRGADVS